MNDPIDAVPASIVTLEGSADLLRVPWQGGEVVWRCFGEGPTMVLLHGGHGSWLHWVRNIVGLAAAHRVLVPDLPGFGDSPKLANGGPTPATLPDIAQALAGTLDAIVPPDDPVDLVGFSFGSLVAAHLAARSGRVRRMALLGAAGHGTPRRQRLEMMNWRAIADPAKETAAFAHNLQALMLHADSSIDPLALWIQARNCKATRFRSRRLSTGATLSAPLAHYNGPLLFVWGEHDVTADPAVAAPLLAEARPKSEWCVIPDAGHWVQYERPFETDRILRRWFAADAVGSSAGHLDREAHRPAPSRSTMR